MIRDILAAVIAANVALAPVQHKHPPQDAAMHDKFYSTWQRPDNRALSCCNQEDCYATEAKFQNGFWYAKQRETGEWMQVPPEKIEHDRDAPDARAHVCASKFGHVYCFISAAGL